MEKVFTFTWLERMSDLQEDYCIISDSDKDAVQTGMTPDAATSFDCLREFFEAFCLPAP